MRRTKRDQNDKKNRKKPPTCELKFTITVLKIFLLDGNSFFSPRVKFPGIGIGVLASTPKFGKQRRIVWQQPSLE